MFASYNLIQRLAVDGSRKRLNCLRLACDPVVRVI